MSHIFVDKSLTRLTFRNGQQRYILFVKDLVRAKEPLPYGTLKVMPSCVSKQTHNVPPTGTNRHPPLALLLVEVKQGLKKISDNPRAYRSKAFTEWYRQAQKLYQSTAWFGAPPIIGERFSQRRFGRSKNLLNDIEIFSLFKQDVQVTMKELDYFTARYRRMEELAHSQKLHVANEALQLPPNYRLICQGLLGALGLLTLGFLLWLVFKS